jgi:hypothetical protein
MTSPCTAIRPESIPRTEITSCKPAHLDLRNHPAHQIAVRPPSTASFAP